MSSPIRDDSSLRWRSQESDFENSLSKRHLDENEVEKKDSRRPSMVVALLTRNKLALIVFVVCALIILHGILTALNRPPPGVVRLETLEDLARSASKRLASGGKGEKSGSLYLFGGAPIVDKVDWLDVKQLGFDEVKRGNGTLGGTTFDPMLWDPQLIDDNGNPKQPLHTNAWWAPFVIPPGKGEMHVVNNSPYLLSVRTKPKGRTDLVGDTAGLTVRGPMLVMDFSSEGDAFGLRQSAGPVGFGFFIGIRLRDYGDEVLRHYVANPLPLSFEKVWEIKRLHEDENEMVDPTRFEIQNMRAFIVRGAPYVTMEVPAGQKLILETLPADIHAAKRNAVERLTNLSGHPTEATHTCTSLMGKPMETDAFEMDLSDGTQWIAVTDQKIQLTCEPGKVYHRFLTAKVLKAPLVVRLALSSLCDHEVVKQKRRDPGVFPSLFYGAEALCPSDQAQILSKTRWKFMTLFNVLPKRHLDDAVQFLSRKGPGKAMFEKVFTRFTLRDQLELISKSPVYGGFELVTLPWRQDLIASAIRDLSSPIDVIVLPDDFTRDSGVNITGDLYYWLNVDFLSVRGKALILTGGISGEGTIKALLRNLFSIHVEHASTSTEDDGLIISKMTQIYDTSPYEKDLSVPPIFRPENMPKQLRWPLAVYEDPLDGKTYNASSKNSIEFMTPQYHGWPFAPYCVRSPAPESCEKLANAFFYWGNGAISWLGMKWEADILPLSEDWAVLLARSLRHGTCSENNRNGKHCAPLKRVLLIEPAAFTEQADFIRTTADLLLNRDGELDSTRLRSFLLGTKSVNTGNIGEPTTEVVDEDSELMRDFLLRHALFYPKKGEIDISVESDILKTASAAVLEYKFFSIPLPGYRTHTLFPPTENVELVGADGEVQSLEEVPLWDPHRLVVYFHELQLKMEQVLYNTDATPRSISNDVNDNACLMTSHGKTCARSFGTLPSLEPSAAVPDYFGAWMYPFKQGNRSLLVVNLPQAGLNSFPIKDPVGQDVDAVRNIHSRWLNILRWALKQDLSGYTKLSSEDLEKKADDMHIWVVLMHRYASLAVAADIAGMSKERRQALASVKAGLEKLLSGRFDNVLVYDSTLGGIVPCGCNRADEGGACIPLPRVGLSEVEFPEGQEGRGGDVQAVLSLGNLCPALRYSSVEGGAGFFQGTQVLFGYIIHMAAVVALFEPEWLNTRLRIFTPTGITKPKVHYIIMSLILNIATPDFFGPYSDPLIRNALHRKFVPHRHKDWWYLNSYDSGIHYVSTAGPYLGSPGESAFAYWAVGQYGKVTKDYNLYRWGSMLAGTEIYSGNAYFRVKEGNTIYPHALRYLGALGRVHESGAFFETSEGVEPHMVYSRQVLPITPFSLELLESGWSLFLQALWQRSCTKNISKCIKEFGDIALAHLNVFVMKWRPDGSPEDKEQQIREIVQATTQVTKVDCFQRKQFECGPHTLTNGMFFAAVAQAVGGAHGILEAEDGNGRFRVY